MTVTRPLGLLGLLILANSTGSLAIDALLPAMPELAKAFDTSRDNAQLGLSAFIFGFGLFQLVYGALSDRIGRKTVLLGGLVISALASFLCLFSTGIFMLAFLRFLQGAGSCAGKTLGMAIVRDLYDTKDSAKAYSLMGAIGAAIPVVNIFVGGELMERFGWVGPFYWMTGFTVMLIVCLYFLLPETLAAQNRLKTPAGLKTVLRDCAFILQNKSYLALVGLLCFAFSGVFIFDSLSSLILIKQLGVTTREYTLLFTAPIMTLSAGLWASAILNRKAHAYTLIVTGAIICLTAGLCSLATTAQSGTDLTALDVIWPVALYFFGSGILFANALALAIAPFPHHAGTAAAFIGCSQMSFSAAISIWSVGHYDGTARILGYSLLLVACGTLVCTLLYRFLANKKPA